jgi:hypothetical protein
MNERIRALQTQAFDLCKTHEGNMAVTDEVFEKFAQLIVRECMLQIADVRIEHDFDPQVDKVLGQALTGIKEYFGVK